ncbi:MAG: hypothetical protein WC752_02030 [Patescibacteria group bacterium]|jgi:hypothetical protein
MPESAKQPIDITSLMHPPQFNNSEEFLKWFQDNIGVQLKPIINKAVRDINPQRLSTDLINQFTQGQINSEEYSRQRPKGSTAGFIRSALENISQRALEGAHRLRGSSPEEAKKKAHDQLWNIEPPAKKAGAIAPTPTAAEAAQGAEEAAAGGEAGAPEGDEGQAPTGEEAPELPEQLSPEQQAEAGRAMKQEQNEGAPGEEAPTEGGEIPSEGGGEEETTPAGEQEPETIPPEEEDEAAKKLAKEKEQQAEQTKQLEEQEAQRGEPPQEGGAPGAEAGQEPSSEQAPEAGKGETPAQVAPGGEQGAASELSQDKNKALSAASKLAQSPAVQEGKAELEKAAQKATQAIIEELIDLGWEGYGCGWLLTFPLLIYLFYLDLVSKGIDVPILGKVKIVKMNMLQKLNAGFQILLAFLVYGIILTIIVIIVAIFVYSAEAVGEVLSGLWETFKDFYNAIVG